MLLILKLLGIVFIVFSTTAVGVNLSMRLHERVESLNWFALMVAEISNKIRSNSMELYGIISGIFDAKHYITVSEPFSVTLKKCGLDKNDEKMIYEFFSELGMGDSASQVKRCEMYGDMIERRRKDAALKLKEKSKLYKMLGLFAGLSLAIILI